MRSARYRPLLFGLAVITAATALLPIVVGALVTSHKAGMAFPDWPTSDGQGMFAYPWLKSAGDKFIEHGHRLAGILIGCVSIVFATACFALEPRRWVRWCGVGVLLAVITQGLLGGGRVLADARILAMFHGASAAVVFTFMSSVALVLSRTWSQPPVAAAIEESARRTSRSCRSSRPLVLVAAVFARGPGPPLGDRALRPCRHGVCRAGLCHRDGGRRASHAVRMVAASGLACWDSRPSHRCFWALAGWVDEIRLRSLGLRGR